MGCCASTPSPSSSPYPTAQPTSSSRAAINNSRTASHTALPRPSTNHTTESSQQAPQPHRSRPLTEHFNRPLRPHIWSSNSRVWARRDLDREREAFFDTRVAGRPEIWLTLRAALEVLWSGGEASGNGDGEEDGGVATAQMIIEAAGVTLPTGDLANGAYDSFGAFYSLPEWVVSDPHNMARGEEDDGDKIVVVGDNEVDEQEEEQERARRREEKGKAVLAEGDLINVKARLSDRGGADVVVSVGKGDSVRLITKRVFEESGLPSTKRVRIVYMGKMLKENESLVAQGWKDDHIVNALVFG